MATRQPNLKARHVFAVIRVDTFHRPTVEAEMAITVKEVVWTQEEAEHEVRRLNELNREKGCRYFWQLSRLAPMPLGDPSQPGDKVVAVSQGTMTEIKAGDGSGRPLKIRGPAAHTEEPR